MTRTQFDTCPREHCVRADTSVCVHPPIAFRTVPPVHCAMPICHHCKLHGIAFCMSTFGLIANCTVGLVQNARPAPRRPSGQSNCLAVRPMVTASGGQSDSIAAGPMVPASKKEVPPRKTLKLGTSSYQRGASANTWQRVAGGVYVSQVRGKSLMKASRSSAGRSMWSAMIAASSRVGYIVGSSSKCSSRPSDITNDGKSQDEFSRQ